MQIWEFTNNYFAFQFEKNDWSRYGILKCKKLITWIKNLPNGEKKSHYWFAEERAWIIHNNYRQAFEKKLKDLFGLETIENLIFGESDE